MSATKDKITEETIVKIADTVMKIKNDELGLRKILFKYIKQNVEDFERTDKYKFDRKFKRGYMKDLKSKVLADLAMDIAIRKQSKREVCRECIIKVNCSTDCETFKERFTELHNPQSKEFWNGQKSEV